MQCYFDWSALAKRFHTEPGSGMVDEIIDGRGNRIFTSRLTLVELTSVATIKVRTGAMTAEAAGKSLSAVAECHKSRQFIAHGVLQEDYDRARNRIAFERSTPCNWPPRFGGGRKAASISRDCRPGSCRCCGA